MAKVRVQVDLVEDYPVALILDPPEPDLRYTDWVEVDESLLARYKAARREWRAVERELRELVDG